MTDKQEQALLLKEKIEQACIEHGLNLTNYHGKIGFVDQEQRKIVMLWSPKYRLSEKEEER